MRSSLKQLEMYQTATLVDSVTTAKQRSKLREAIGSSWEKPQVHQLKTNWDVAVNPISNNTGLGGTMRKWRGHGLLLTLLQVTVVKLGTRA